VKRFENWFTFAKIIVKWSTFLRHSVILVLEISDESLCVQAAEAAVPAQFERLITINKGSSALGKFRCCFKMILSYPFSAQTLLVG